MKKKIDENATPLFFALVQAPFPLPFPPHHFSAWKKVTVLCYQGAGGSYNSLVVFYGKKSEVPAKCAAIKAWAAENRNTVRQVYQVYAVARPAFKNLVENELKTIFVERKEKSPYLQWFDIIDADQGKEDVLMPSCDTNLYLTEDDYRMYEDDLMAFFSVFKKIFYDKSQVSKYVPLLDSKYNPMVYFYPLAFLSSTNENIEYETLLQRSFTPNPNGSLYTVFVSIDREQLQKNVSKTLLVENMSVFFELHFGVKLDIDVSAFHENDIVCINVMLSNTIPYYVFVLALLVALRQQLEPSHAFRIVDVVGFHEPLSVQEAWNIVRKVALSKNPKEQMVTSRYQSKRMMLHKKGIEEKKMVDAPHLDVLHSVPLDLYDLYHEASSTSTTGGGKKTTVDKELADILQKNQHKEWIKSFLPYGAQQRLKNNNSKDEKENEWCNIVCSLPFGKYHTSAPLHQGRKRKRTTLGNVQDIIADESISNATLKELSEDVYISHVLNPQSPKKPILLTGPPGNGKTHYAARVLPKILHDRPVCFISVAGVQDPHVLLGHDFTYIGAKPGKIIQEIIDVKCLDPIMIFDEVDKAGPKVQNTLISLLDPLQNHAYKDLFLGNVSVDLSRAFFVMTCNEHSTDYVSAPLLDRMRVVQVPRLSASAQLSILQNVIVPRVMRDVLGKDDDTDTEEATARICRNVCDEGVCREILALSQDFDQDKENGGIDANGGISLRCIEKTTHKVIIEFIKDVMHSVQSEDQDNAEEQEDETDEIKHDVLWFIHAHGKKIESSHVQASRRSLHMSLSKKSSFLSYLYT